MPAFHQPKTGCANAYSAACTAHPAPPLLNSVLPNCKYSLMHKKTDKSIFKNCISEKFRKQHNFLLVFYLVMCFMKA